MQQTRPRVLQVNVLDLIALVVVVVLFALGGKMLTWAAPVAAPAIALVALGYAGLRLVLGVQRQRDFDRLAIRREEAMVKREEILNKQEDEKITSLIHSGDYGNYPVYRAPDGGLHIFSAGNIIQPVPSVYSPQIHSHVDYHSLKELPASGQMNQVAPPTLVTEVPTFGQLLLSGKIGQSKGSVLWGFRDDGTPVFFTWKQILTLLILGNTDNGKTATLLNLAGQAYMDNARFIIVDPDKNNEQGLAYQLEPLRDRFLIEPARSEKEVEKASDLAYSFLDARAGGAKIDFPVLFLVDELTRQLGQRQAGNAYDKLALTLELYASGGRKDECYAAAIGHLANASRASSEFKQLAQTYVLHQSSTHQANMLLQDNLSEEEIPFMRSAAPQLAKGQILLYVPRFPLTRLRVQYTTRADLELVAAHGNDQASQNGFQSRFPVGSPSVSRPALSVPVETNRDNAKEHIFTSDLLPKLSPDLLAKVAQARDLRALEPPKSRTEIVQALWGLTGKGGRDWSAYMADYEKIESFIIASDALAQLQERLYFTESADQQEEEIL